MATYFRDFSDADGISDFTEVELTSGDNAPNWSVVNTDQLQATSSFSDNTAFVWNDIDGDADADDAEILGEIYVNATSTTQRWYGLRISKSGSSRTGYALRVRTSSFDLYKLNGSTYTQIATAAVTITSGTWVWVRFRMNGSDIMARYWTTTEDTGSWTVSQTGETTYTTVGHVGVIKGANTNTQLWRKFGVGTNGDTAPTSAGATAMSLAMTRRFPRAILNF